MMLKHLTWNTLTTGLRTGLSLLRYLLIARYLSPRDFGLFALAKGLIELFSLPKRLASNGSLITTDVSDAQRGSLYVLDLLLGILLYGLVFQAAPRLALWFAEPELTRYLRFIGFILPLLSLTDQWYLLFQKTMAWRFLGFLRVAAFFLGIVTLYFTHSLIWETLVQYGVSVLVVATIGLRRFPMPFAFSGPDLRASLVFGFNEIARNSVSQLTGRISHLFLVRTFGTEALGWLSMAQKLAFQGPNRISPILTQLVLPALARTRAKRSLLYRVVLLLAGVNALVSGVVIVFGPAMMTFIFGAAWRPVAPLARILAVGAFFSALSLPLPDYLLSVHRLRSVFVLSVVVSLFQLLAVSVGSVAGSLLVLVWCSVIADALIFGAWIVVSLKQPGRRPQRIFRELGAAVSDHAWSQIQKIRNRLK